MSDVNLDREIALVKLQNEIALVKLQNDHKLACLGLQGTLWGAWAGLIAIVAIAAIQAVTDRHVVDGWAFFLDGRSDRGRSHFLWRIHF